MVQKSSRGPTDKELLSVGQDEVATPVDAHVLCLPAGWKELDATRDIFRVVAQNIDGLESPPESYSMNTIRLCSIISGPEIQQQQTN